MQGLTIDPGTPPQQMREAAISPGPSESFFELELSFDDDIIQEVEGYTKTSVATINVQPQGTRGDPSLAANLAPY